MRKIIYIIAAALLLLTANSYADVGCSYTVKPKVGAQQKGKVDDKPIVIKLNGANWKACTVSKLNLFSQKWDNPNIRSKQEVGASMVCSTKNGAAMNLNASVEIETKVGELKTDNTYNQLLDKLISYDGNSNTTSVGNNETYEVSLFCYSCSGENCSKGLVD